MSEALEQVVAKAVKDDQFRQLLLSNPEKALAGYNLTKDEQAMLEGLTEESFDDFAGSLGDRSTKGFMPTSGT